MRQGLSFGGPALALTLVLAAPIEDARPALAQTDRLANVPTVVIGVSVSIWPAIVAKEKGFFAEQGLDIDFGNSCESIAREPGRCVEDLGCLHAGQGLRGRRIDHRPGGGARAKYAVVQRRAQAAAAAGERLFR
jgi:hypothetical protein